MHNTYTLDKTFVACHLVIHIFENSYYFTVFRRHVFFQISFTEAPNFLYGEGFSSPVVNVADPPPGLLSTSNWLKLKHESDLASAAKLAEL